MDHVEMLQSNIEIMGVILLPYSHSYAVQPG
jgi:hypothetical protein